MIIGRSSRHGGSLIDQGLIGTISWYMSRMFWQRRRVIRIIGPWRHTGARISIKVYTRALIKGKYCGIVRLDRIRRFVAVSRIGCRKLISRLSVNMQGPENDWFMSLTGRCREKLLQDQQH